MMTVKVIVQQAEGEDVYLFPTTRVSYQIKQLGGDYSGPKETFYQYAERQNPQYVISGINESNVTKNTLMAWISLYDEDGSISMVLVGAPATCYIMSEGKTIDRFFVTFIEA